MWTRRYVILPPRDGYQIIEAAHRNCRAACLAVTPHQWPASADRPAATSARPRKAVAGCLELNVPNDVLK
jgi:hypothetical protein